MKTVVFNKELNFSLHNIENYKKIFSCEIDVILENYSTLLVEYLKFIIANIKIKNNVLTKFIISRGLDTITHVFLNILLYTKNIDLTYFHCEKAFYFYVEFVSQISEDDKMFLQLTSRDASIYVYKKTIFEINNEYKKINEDMTNDVKDTLVIINSYTYIYKLYLHKIIDKNETTMDNYMEIFKKISSKLNKLKEYGKIKKFEKAVDKLSNNINSLDLFLNINLELVKKFIKNPNLLDNIEKKILENDFESKIDKIDKFISWFLN